MRLLAFGRRPLAVAEDAPMTMGSMSWACLVLAMNVALPPDIVPMNARSFQIPIRIEPSRHAEIQTLVLWISRDEGQSWQIYGESTPDKESFSFIADRDGSYWFTVQVVTKKGDREPSNPAQAPVGLKTVVDTQKPEVRLNAERHGDEVALNWEVIEANPDPATLKIEYRTVDMPAEQWVAVPATPLPGQSRLAFKGSPSAMAVRLQMLDVCGNLGRNEVQVPAANGPRPVSLERTEPVTSIVPPDAVGEKIPTPHDVPHYPGPLSEEPHGTPIAQGAAPSSTGTGGIPTPTSTVAPQPSPSMSATMPPVQIINKRQVKLDFQVGKFGPSGVGSVDVYVTMDDGHTWEKSEIDRSAILPGTTDVRSGQPLHGSVMVQLNKPEPAIYGFYLVVKSRAGLGKPAPRPGAAPQVRVEVDTTMPEAELYKPQPDPNQQDTLMLSWKASDRNLAPNPVTLEWAEHKEGPWTFIQSPELPNTGKLTWHVSDNMPYQVYLRLTVRDQAGNSAVAETREPVVIDLSVPSVDDVTLSANANPAPSPH
jgi:hypothetical protein